VGCRGLGVLVHAGTRGGWNDVHLVVGALAVRTRSFQRGCHYFCEPFIYCTCTASIPLDMTAAPKDRQLPWSMEDNVTSVHLSWNGGIEHHHVSTNFICSYVPLCPPTSCHCRYKRRATYDGRARERLGQHWSAAYLSNYSDVDLLNVEQQVESFIGRHDARR
jgi:hypothetical protein